jgi:hypothetical protein
MSTDIWVPGRNNDEEAFVKSITRREMLKEVVSKDTVKQVAKAWYSFSMPVEQQLAPPKPESLLDKVKKINMKYTKITSNPNGKEG